MKRIAIKVTESGDGSEIVNYLIRLGYKNSNGYIGKCSDFPYYFTDNSKIIGCTCESGKYSIDSIYYSLEEAKQDREIICEIY